MAAQQARVPAAEGQLSDVGIMLHIYMPFMRVPENGNDAGRCLSVFFMNVKGAKRL